MKNKTYVIQPILEKKNRQNPSILRFIISDSYTRVDFGYAAPWIYIKGGWIKIAAHSFLRVKGSNEKYCLTNAVNIPISPAKLEFETKQDWTVFSLYFEPIPLKDCIVDLIEEEKPNDNDFNFYGIELVNVKSIEIQDI
jgi:hypothetical protein